MRMSIYRSIHNLKFSRQGQAALKRIRTRMVLYGMGTALMMSGTLNLILTRSNFTQRMYNITLSDWDLLLNVVSDWPIEMKKIITKEAIRMKVVTTVVELEFWKILIACIKH